MISNLVTKWSQDDPSLFQLPLPSGRVETCQSYLSSQFLEDQFGQLCIKLRKRSSTYFYLVKSQNFQFSMKPSSIFVIFEDLNFVQDPRTFKFRSPRVPKIKLITLNFQPLFGSVVVYCHMDGSILRQRTRGLEESTIQYSFSLGSWEKSQHMNSFLWNFQRLK